jgi:predicted dehydrogenase
LTAVPHTESTPPRLGVAVIGAGYWGPNLIRNAQATPSMRVEYLCDLDESRARRVLGEYSTVKVSTSVDEVLADPAVDAVAIATPAATHHEVAMKALAAGKHVLVEKPLAPTYEEGLELAETADRNGLILMIDHTFCYTNAVAKLREMVRGGELGQLQYLDSVRINLGLFQPDYNVIWDLAPHDLTIIDYVLGHTLGATARWISAIGVSHYGRHENLAYLTIGFDDGLLAHIHVNWIAPVKTRRIIIAGDKKMLVWDDTSPVEPVKIYQSSVDVKAIDKESAYALNVQYRSGDVTSPKLDGREALSVMAQAFAAACLDGKASDSDGAVGVRITRLLEAAQRSLEQQGARIAL